MTTTAVSLMTPSCVCPCVAVSASMTDARQVLPLPGHASPVSGSRGSWLWQGKDRCCTWRRWMAEVRCCSRAGRRCCCRSRYDRAVAAAWCWATPPVCSQRTDVHRRRRHRSLASCRVIVQSLRRLSCWDRRRSRSRRCHGSVPPFPARFTSLGLAVSGSHSMLLLDVKFRSTTIHLR